MKHNWHHKRKLNEIVVWMACEWNRHLMRFNGLMWDYAMIIKTFCLLGACRKYYYCHRCIVVVILSVVVSHSLWYSPLYSEGLKWMSVIGSRFRYPPSFKKGFRHSCTNFSTEKMSSLWCQWQNFSVAIFMFFGRFHMDHHKTLHCKLCWWCLLCVGLFQLVVFSFNMLYKCQCQWCFYARILDNDVNIKKLNFITQIHEM
jgi:hypothetical protein